MPADAGLFRTLDSPGGVTPRWGVVLAIGGLLCLVLVGYVFVNGNEFLPELSAFVLGYSLSVFILAGITALLLFTHARATRRRGYLILGATFLYVAILMAVYPLVYAGALFPSGRVLGGLQSSVVLFYLGALAGARHTHRCFATLGVRGGSRVRARQGAAGGHDLGHALGRP